MRMSIMFGGFGGLADTIPQVRAADAAGLDGVWSAEHLGFHDAVVPSATYIGMSDRLDVGLIGLSTAGRHPGLTAMEVMSLCELAPGRIRIQVGLGDDSLVGKLGRKISKPIASTTAFVESLREAFRGSEMRVKHPEFEFDGFRLSPLGPPPPIDVMAIRPKMVEMSTRVADGLSVSTGASQEYLRDTIRDVERGLRDAGRSRESFRVTALAMCAIGDDVEALCAPLAPMLATFPQATAAVLARGVIDGDEAVRVEREEGPFGVMKMWTPDRVAKTGVITTPGDLAASLAAYADAGVDELALMLINEPEDHERVIKLLADARP